MFSTTPGPIPLATGGVQGQVSTALQTFGGRKLFPQGAVANPYHVENFGYVPGGDVCPAVEAALAAVPTEFGTDSYGIVELPVGLISQSRPIKIANSGANFTGAGVKATRLVVGGNTVPYFEGPQVYLGSPTNFAAWAGPLIGSTGRSVVLDVSNAQRLIDFTQLGTMGNLGLYSALAVEVAIDVSTVTNGGSGSIVSSNGSLSASGYPTLGATGGCFEMTIFGLSSTTFSLSVGLRTVSGTQSVTSGTLNINTVNDVSFNYDGSALWLYINGIYQATASLSGSLLQQPTETVQLGPTCGSSQGLGPMQGGILGSITGKAFGLRISKAARHTGASNYTPRTAAFVFDTDTLLLLNGDQGDDDTFVKVQCFGNGGIGTPSNGIPGYARCYDTTDSAVNEVSVGNMTIDGKTLATGMSFYGARQCFFENLDFAEFAKYGMAAESELSFFNLLSCVQAEGAQNTINFAFGNMGASAAWGLNSIGGAICLDSGSLLYLRPNLSPSSDTLVAARACSFAGQFYNATYVGVIVDGENNVRADYIGGLLLTGGSFGSFTQLGGNWEVLNPGISAGGAPSVVYDSPPANVSFNGTVFEISTASGVGRLQRLYASVAPANRLMLRDASSGVNPTPAWQVLHPEDLVLDGAQVYLQSFTDTSGTPGAATIKTKSGRIALASGASSVVVTCPYMTPETIVRLSKESLDATLTDFSYAYSSSPVGFTITGNANATAAVIFSFDLLVS